MRIAALASNGLHFARRVVRFLMPFNLFVFCRGTLTLYMHVWQDLPLAGKLAKLLQVGLLVPGM